MKKKQKFFSQVSPWCGECRCEMMGLHYYGYSDRDRIALLCHSKTGVTTIIGANSKNVKIKDFCEETLRM